MPSRKLILSFKLGREKNIFVKFVFIRGWKKSKQFNSKEDWENYVAKFSLQINNPLEVKIIQ